MESIRAPSVKSDPPEPGRGGVRLPREGRLPQSKFSRGMDDFLRRLIDIIAACLGLLLLSPLFLVVTVAIKRSSPGPIHYFGPRVGRNGKLFKIVKFRTMHETPASYQGPRITAQGDSRITPLGAWLRNTKLNELPQLWNVLFGDMSLVGPRPEDPAFVEAWDPAIRAELLSVRPGITSPASVIYRDEEKLLQGDNPVDHYLRSVLPSKLRLDVLYVRSRTILTDLDVIFWTLITLIPQLRRIPRPEYRLYWGPFAIFYNRFLTWFVGDYLTTLGAIGVAGLVWRLGGPFHVGLTQSLLVALGFAMVFSLANAIFGLNRIYWSKAPAGDALDLLVSSSLSMVILILGTHFFLPAYFPVVNLVAFPIPMLVFSAALAYGGFVTVRYRERIITGLATRWLDLRGGVRAIGERVLIIGAGEAGEFASWLLRKSDLAQAFYVVGMVDDDPRKQGLRIDGHMVIGTTDQIPEIVITSDVGLVLFAISRIRLPDRQRILRLCEETRAHVVMIPDIISVLNDHFTPGANLHPNTIPRSTLRKTTVRIWLEDLDDLLAAGDVAGARRRLDELQDFCEPPHQEVAEVSATGERATGERATEVAAAATPTTKPEGD